MHRPIAWLCDHGMSLAALCFSVCLALSLPVVADELPEADADLVQLPMMPVSEAEGTEVKLLPGDEPPPIRVAQFLKGEPVADFEMGKLYVIEFWATWCPPCVDSIPHLSKLQKEYPQITFVGVAVYDEREEVESFLKEDPKRFSYRVAIDEESPPSLAELRRRQKLEQDEALGDGEQPADEQPGLGGGGVFGPRDPEQPDPGANDGEDMLSEDMIDDDEDSGGGVMAKSWLEASGSGGIPTAFIVDGSGRIAWIGHPMRLDEPLDQIVHGDWSIEQAREDYLKSLADNDDLMNETGESLFSGFPYTDFGKTLLKIFQANRQGSDE